MTTKSPTHTFTFDELPRGFGTIGAVENIHRILDGSNMNVSAELYDEALVFAREGKLSASTERLQMLLVLDPTDSEAALLLSKVLAARNMWQEALSRLDTAVSNGAILPPGLRDEVVSRLRQEIQEAEVNRNREAQRENSELTRLREEAKTLRSENAALDVEVEGLVRRVRWWASTTALVAGSASALLIASLLFGESGMPEVGQWVDRAEEWVLYSWRTPEPSAEAQRSPEDQAIIAAAAEHQTEEAEAPTAAPEPEPEPDEDNDGVPDTADKCPGTPPVTGGEYYTASASGCDPNQAALAASGQIRSRQEDDGTTVYSYNPGELDKELVPAGYGVNNCIWLDEMQKYDGCMWF